MSTPMRSAMTAYETRRAMVVGVSSQEVVVDHHGDRPARAGGAVAIEHQADEGASAAAVLLRLAAAGDRQAWERLVAKYARLIWAMTREFKLGDSDAADVVQATWLRLLEHIDRIEHPERVGSWLATTARHECLRHVARRKKVMLVDDDVTFHDVADQPDLDERLLARESAEEVRQALSRLPWRWQRLLELLMTDPPASYAEISSQLDLPVGSIGPTRGRCLERLRVMLQAS